MPPALGPGQGGGHGGRPVGDLGRPGVHPDQCAGAERGEVPAVRPAGAGVGREAAVPQLATQGEVQWDVQMSQQMSTLPRSAEYLREF